VAERLGEVVSIGLVLALELAAVLGSSASEDFGDERGEAVEDGSILSCGVDFKRDISES